MGTILNQPGHKRSPLPLNFQGSKSPLTLDLTTDSSLHLHKCFFVPSLVRSFIHSFVLQPPCTFHLQVARYVLVTLITPAAGHSAKYNIGQSSSLEMTVAQGHIDFRGP